MTLVDVVILVVVLAVVAALIVVPIVHRARIKRRGGTPSCRGCPYASDGGCSKFQDTDSVKDTPCTSKYAPRK